MNPRLLFIEDDRTLAPLVRDYLIDHHFDVIWSADGNEGWREFEKRAPDLVILDLMLPGRDGFTLCRQIRASGSTGILMLTAKGNEADRIVGLELGADDYLTKPFSMPELVARIRAILRRCRPDGTELAVNQRTIGPYVLDRSCRQIRRGDQTIALTRSEFDMLDRLTRRVGKVFSREELLQEVRGGETEALNRAVDTHISNLRAKLEVDPKHPQFIQTVWGVGYRWGAS